MISSLSLVIFNLVNRPTNVDKSCQNKPFIGFTMPESGIPEGSRKSLTPAIRMTFSTYVSVLRKIN